MENWLRRANFDKTKLYKTLQKLTPLQKRVAEEFVACSNISLAAERAGIEGDNARISAWQMLQFEDVQDYIQQLQNEAAIRCQISKDEWLKEFKLLGFSNIRNYMTDQLDAKDLSEVENPECIKKIKKTIKSSENGTDTTIEFELHDKISALVNIGRHLGWFEKDNAQKGLKIKGAKIVFK